MDQPAIIRRDDARTAPVLIRLSDGSVVYIEATSVSGDVPVASKIADFDKLTSTIVAVAKSLGAAIVAVAPDKATVEFGVEASLDAGGLTALIVKGSSKANLKITLEWSRSNNATRPGT